MEIVGGLFFVLFMLLVDHRLHKIYKQLELLNKGVKYLASLAEKRSS